MLRILAAAMLGIIPALALAGSGYDPPASGGGVDVCSSDWADPCHGTDAVTLADWPDADDAGGADGICRDQVADGRIRLRSALDSDCSTDYASATRTGGVLRTIGAGDFRVAVRFGWAPKSWANFGGTHLAGVAFVDGADASTASWYGIAAYAAAGTVVLYDFQQAAGAARWEGYQAAAFTAIATAWPVVDVVIERVGTTLTHYCAPAQGAFVACGTETVSAGAGLIGLRVQVETSTADEFDVVLDAYRTGLSEVP